MTASSARLGADRSARIRDRIVERYWSIVDLLVSEYLADGYAPFKDKLTPYEQYQHLIAQRGAGDPAFWANPKAAAALAYYEQRFGPAPPIAGPGYAPAGIAAHPAQLAGATMAMQGGMQ